MPTDLTTNPAGAPDIVEPVDERGLREDLAACYRLVDHFGLTDLIFTHISARVPGPEHHFLINPFGLLFHEITASNLVKVDVRGNVVGTSDYGVNPAGFMIHSAIHMNRADALCVVHLHGKDGAAVAASKEGLLPLSQTAMVIIADLAYHDYALTVEESLRAKLARDVGDKNNVILRNHGTLTLGTTPAEAFARAYALEWACTVQVRALASARELNFPDPDVVAALASQSKSTMPRIYNDDLWPALRRMLDSSDPSYRD